jgi:protein-arginine kinase
MQAGGDVLAVFERLARGIKAVGDSVMAESGKDFLLSPKFGYIHSCPTNLGTGMRASVHVDLPGWNKEGLTALKARCEALALQPRGTRGESGGDTGKFLKLLFYVRIFLVKFYHFLKENVYLKKSN